MFQKWLIAFLADRGWRYLQNRRTRKQLGRVIEKRARRGAKAQKAQRRSGFKPGRALTFMAIGAGAYAYFRSRQQTAWNDQFSTPPSTSNPTGLTSSAAATTTTPVTSTTTEPEAMAPFYNAGDEHLAPATPGDTAMVVEADGNVPTLDADPLAPQADTPTYTAQASLDESDTLAIPAANPEDDAAEAVAPTYNAQAALNETTLAVPAANPEDDVPADVETLDGEVANNPAATDIAAKEAPDDQRI